MPTTPVLALPYPSASDTADVPRDIQALAVKLDAYTSLRPPLVTALPGSPADGQECYYAADAASGVLWHLRYNTASSSPYKWELVGGSGLEAEVAAQSNLASIAGGYSDTADGLGPQITAPLAGDYDVTAVCAMFSSTAGGGNTVIGLRVGATDPPSPLLNGGSHFTTPSQGGVALPFSRVRAVTAATIIRMRYAAQGSGQTTIAVAGRRMKLVPVRVG